MTFRRKIRHRVGLFGAWCLGRIFAYRLPRLLVLHGFVRASKTDLGIEITNEDPIEQLAYAYLRTVRPVTALAKAIEQACGADLEWIHEKVREHVEGDDRSALHGIRIFIGAHRWLERHAGGARGKRVLELGPGHTLVTGALLVASGVERYVGADLFPIASLDATLYKRVRTELAGDRDLVRASGYYEAWREMLARFDAAVRFDGDKVLFEESLLSWKHPVDAGQLPFADAMFDVCMSNACFEHFRDPEAAARECVRVVIPGGVNVHQIDLRDHRDFSRPLEFLRFEKAHWDRLFGGDGPRPPAELGPIRTAFEYTNRWRLNDYVRAFECAGGEVVTVDVNLTTPVPDELRATLHADFRDRPREELEALSAFVVVRKKI